jgi:hypothetical protein
MPPGCPADAAAGVSPSAVTAAIVPPFAAAMRIPVMTMATMTTMPRASRSATLTLLSPTSLDSAVLICCGTM